MKMLTAILAIGFSLSLASVDSHAQYVTKRVKCAAYDHSNPLIVFENETSQTQHIIFKVTRDGC